MALVMVMVLAGVHAVAGFWKGERKRSRTWSRGPGARSAKIKPWRWSRAYLLRSRSCDLDVFNNAKCCNGEFVSVLIIDPLLVAPGFGKLKSVVLNLETAA